MSPHYLRLFGRLPCCLQTCNYDHSLVVIDTNTLQVFLFQLWVSNNHMNNFAHHSPIDLRWRAWPILSTTVLSDKVVTSSGFVVIAHAPDAREVQQLSADGHNSKTKADPPQAAAHANTDYFSIQKHSSARC